MLIVHIISFLFVNSRVKLLNLPLSLTPSPPSTSSPTPPHHLPFLFSTSPSPLSLFTHQIDNLNDSNFALNADYLSKDLMEHLDSTESQMLDRIDPKKGESRLIIDNSKSTFNS